MRERLFTDLFDKVEDNSKIVIFGACEAAAKIMKDLAVYKTNSKVIGFIDNYYKNSFNNLPVWTLDEFIKYPEDYDLVILSTRTDENTIVNIFDILDIPVLKLTPSISDYYRNKHAILSRENYRKVIDIFENEKDKKLYDLLFDYHIGICPKEKLEDYHFNQRLNRYQTYHVMRSQYLENINKNVIRTVLDLGFNNGLNFIAFNKFMPNLEKVYGFEAIYDVVRTDYIEKLLDFNKLEIVSLALGDILSESKFYINLKNISASFCGDLTTRINPVNSPDYKEVTVKISTIDKYCTDNNIKPDFIKMDIEGSELPALKGGIETIKKYRAQLAISIYHTAEDFINIPLYLKENLENYHFALGHYSPRISETVLYAIPKELI